jgi:DNA-binding SARP family transcriptional activator
MAAERTRYQEKIIKNYYRNLDAIALQKATEAITELYLTTGKKREQVWKRLIGHMEKLEMPADQIAHLREQDNPELIVQALKKFS